MSMWKRLGPVAAAAVSLAVVLACANGAEESGSDDDLIPEDSGTETPEPTSDPSPGPTDEAETPEIDMPEEHAEIVDQMIRENSVGWEDYEVVSETELRFLATSGNQACYGQRYQTAESEDEVAVAIITGQREDGAEICTQEAVFIAVPVQLDEPLGERDVVELAEPELNQ